MKRKSQCFLLLFLLSTVGAMAQDLSGSWWGKLVFPQGSLRIGLHLKHEGVNWSATMDSPDQGATGLPIPDVCVSGDTLIIGVPQLNLSYRGIYDGQEIKGEFRQNGMSLPLTFQRGGQTESCRVQDPKPPYPYLHKNIEVRNKADDLLLAGTLTIPNGKSFPKPQDGYPAILFVTGSGPQDRDEEILGHRPFLVLADSLTRAGFVTLRCDDRGTGESTGVFARGTTFDFVRDAEAELQYLKHMPMVDKRRIIVLGHSEGALIAEIMASKDKDIALIAMLGAPSLRGDRILEQQRRTLTQMQDPGEAELQKAERIDGQVYAIAMDTTLTDSVMRHRVEAVLDRELSDNVNRSAIIETVKNQLTPWVRTFLRIDPADYIGRINCPVLAIYGGKDLQVPAVPNADILTKSLKPGVLKQSVIKIFPEVNHLFQTAKTGLPSEYGEINETVARPVLKFLVNELKRMINKVKQVR